VASLRESELYIWYRCTELLDGDAVKLADQYLSIEERARRDRFHVAADRRDFTIAHDLLRRTLSRYVDRSPSDWCFSNDCNGKPFIENSDAELRTVSFSLSHTRGCVACAIALYGPVGIDVERISKSERVQAIANKYFSAGEVEWLRQCSTELRDICFTELWTLKEAFLKAVGTGLSGSLSSTSFRFDDDGGIKFSAPSAINPDEWHFALFEPAYDVRLGVGIHSAARPHFIMCSDEDDGRTLAPIRVST